MPCLLYCVSLISPDTTPSLDGVADQPVVTCDAHGLRVYWSEVGNPEALRDGQSRKIADGKYRQVLREILAVTTPLAFPFPAVVEDVAAIDVFLAEQQETYIDALTRLAGMVQFELTATWTDDEQADLAKPVSGREYLRRRQEAEARTSAIDAKLRSVTADIVREWRAKQERRNRIWCALVPRDAREPFITALRGAGPSEGVRLRLSGPWPPNEFV